MSSVETKPLAAQGALERLQNRFVVFEAGLLLSVAVGIFAAKLAFDEMGVGVDGRAAFVGVLLAALAAAPSRLHLPLKIVTRSVRIFRARPERIWEAIAPRATTDFYRPEIRRIDKIAEEPATYRFHLRDLGPPCRRCARHRNPHLDNGTYESVVVEWEENRRLRLVRVRTCGSSNPVSRGGEASWTIEPHGTGAKVAFVGATSDPLLWYWLQATFGMTNLAENALGELAHHLGEAPADGGFGAARECLAAAKSARAYCSCR
jgi:hypothetical protein